MPVMDGLQLTKKLRELHPTTPPYIICATASADEVKKKFNKKFFQKFFPPGTTETNLVRSWSKLFYD
jgi:CheY-like chemotaxis protein